ncbi:hypothetical protein PCL_00846 [Purpureocillium lilacinum]|uniref:Uncharacterized protein n=1 Tax=Purpureocillium lilacinum TaxID=33203 RepID=A0A2U3E3Y5_PURLI|nr:hypothetical protein PCL_00846 [Purpureocillium lilacinum]
MDRRAIEGKEPREGRRAAKGPAQRKVDTAEDMDDGSSSGGATFVRLRWTDGRGLVAAVMWTVDRPLRSLDANSQGWHRLAAKLVLMTALEN